MWVGTVHVEAVTAPCRSHAGGSYMPRGGQHLLVKDCIISLISLGGRGT